MIIQRDLFSTILPLLDSPETIVITGMRRVGKTTLLKSIFDHISSENKIYLDLENPRNQIYFQEKDYDVIKKNLELMGLKSKEPCYVFLDEIQWVKQLPSAVKYLMDTYKIKFILTGSSSFYLKNQFSESLAGRKFIFELYPLNFSEFLRIKQAPPLQNISHESPTLSMFTTYQTYVDEYLKYGGFPGVVLKPTENEKKAALEDIFTSYYQLEVLQLSDFKKSNKIRDLLFLLMERTGSRLDIQKLANVLGLSRPTLNEYIYFLEGTYFIKVIKPYSTNRDVEIRKAGKLYVCDPGLVRQFSQVDEGSLFENAIFWNLHQKGNVQYYQRKNGTEIDFIVNNNFAYEVKIHATKEDLNKLQSLTQDINIKHFNLISRDYLPQQNVLYLFNL